MAQLAAEAMGPTGLAGLSSPGDAWCVPLMLSADLLAVAEHRLDDPETQYSDPSGRWQRCLDGRGPPGSISAAKR